MRRRIRGFGLSLLGISLIVTGCTEFHRGLRSQSDDKLHATSHEEDGETDKVLDVKSDSKPFFKSNRLSGAMSSEGREIEQSLGIH